MLAIQPFFISPAAPGVPICRAPGSPVIYADRRKLKGVATVRLKDGSIHTAEVHWYEAHGIGRQEFKLKLPFLD